MQDLRFHWHVCDIDSVDSLGVKKDELIHEDGCVALDRLPGRMLAVANVRVYRAEKLC